MSHCHIKNNYIHINIQAQPMSNLHLSLCSFRYLHLLVLKELLFLYDIIFWLCVIFRGSQIRNRETTSCYFLHTLVVVVQLIFTMFKRNKPKKKKVSSSFFFSNCQPLIYKLQYVGQASLSGHQLLLYKTVA